MNILNLKVMQFRTDNETTICKHRKQCDKGFVGGFRRRVGPKICYSLTILCYELACRGQSSPHHARQRLLDTTDSHMKPVVTSHTDDSVMTGRHYYYYYYYLCAFCS